jgi:hypothetical protein
MRLLTLSLLFSFSILTTSALRAQVHPGIFGHQMTGVNGTAGEFCQVFDCTPRTFNAQAGETLTLCVNAPLNALFAIGASFSATSCLSLPVAANSLILDQPIVTLAIGTVNTPSPILACWGGTVTVPLSVPQSAVGISFATQAVADVPNIGGNRLAFSVAILATVH